MNGLEWISEYTASIWNIIWNGLGLLLGVVSVYLGWKSIKMNLPSVKKKAKKDIIFGLQEYLIENPDVTLTNMRSIIDTISLEHNLDLGIITEPEILKEMRTSIIVTPLLESSLKGTLLNKLDKAENKFLWVSVEKEIDWVFEELEKMDVVRNEEIAEKKTRIISICKRHVETLDDYQSIKIKFVNASYRKSKMLMSLLFFVLISMIVAFSISGRPVESVVHYSPFLFPMLIGLLIVGYAANYVIQSTIVFLGSLGFSNSDLEVKVPKLVKMLFKIFK